MKAFGENTPACGVSIPSPAITDMAAGTRLRPRPATGRLKPSIKPPPTAAPTDTPSLRNARRDGASGASAGNGWPLMSGLLRRVLDGGADAVIGAAAADVAGHG